MNMNGTPHHCTILVSGIPSDIDEDTLKMIFEKEKYGGGAIKNMDLQADQAFITFESCQGQNFGEFGNITLYKLL